MSKFKSEVRNGYLWTDRVVNLKAKPGSGISGRAGWPKDGPSHKAWIEFRTWFLNEGFKQTLISRVTGFSRQMINGWLRQPSEKMTDAFTHRNLLFLASLTPVIEEDTDLMLNRLSRARALDLSRQFNLHQDIVEVSWKARQLMIKHNVTPTDSWLPYVIPE